MLLPVHVVALIRTLPTRVLAESVFLVVVEITYVYPAILHVCEEVYAMREREKQLLVSYKGKLQRRKESFSVRLGHGARVSARYILWMHDTQRACERVLVSHTCTYIITSSKLNTHTQTHVVRTCTESKGRE